MTLRRYGSLIEAVNVCIQFKFDKKEKEHSFYEIIVLPHKILL
jgi:ribosomal protein L1